MWVSRMSYWARNIRVIYRRNQDLAAEVAEALQERSKLFGINDEKWWKVAKETILHTKPSGQVDVLKRTWTPLAHVSNTAFSKTYGYKTRTHIFSWST